MHEIAELLQEVRSFASTGAVIPVACFLSRGLNAGITPGAARHNGRGAQPHGPAQLILDGSADARQLPARMGAACCRLDAPNLIGACSDRSSARPSPACGDRAPGFPSRSCAEVFGQQTVSSTRGRRSPNSRDDIAINQIALSSRIFSFPEVLKMDPARGPSSIFRNRATRPDPLTLPNVPPCPFLVPFR